MVVKKVLEDMGLVYNKVEIGQIDLKYPLTKFQRESLNIRLNNWDLSLIDSNNDILVEKIKAGIMDMIHNDSSMSPMKISHYLSQCLNHNYTYLSNVFSQETGICLRDYIIAHKVEKIKNLLIFDELTISEIAWKLKYSSVAHLSNQFSRVTGLSPSKFKKNPTIPLIPREKVGLMSAV
jgi:AraC-like DNA-binding protein